MESADIGSDYKSIKQTLTPPFKKKIYPNILKNLKTKDDFIQYRYEKTNSRLPKLESQIFSPYEKEIKAYSKTFLNKSDNNKGYLQIQNGSNLRKSQKAQNSMESDKKMNKKQIQDSLISEQRILNLMTSSIQKQQLSYIIDPGNNSDIVRRVLRKRNWIQEAPSNCVFYSFRWKPISQGINFDELSKNQAKKQVVNHIEFHQEISCKNRLYNNIRAYCRNQKLNIDTILPKTFILNIDTEHFSNDLHQFLDSFIQINKEMRYKNIWLLKPNDQNRGRGIHLFNKLKNLYLLLADYGKEKEFRQKLTEISNGEIQLDYESLNQYRSQKQENNKNHVKNRYERTIVLQKYIENPLLLNGRKFDIRIFVLIDHEFKYYVFREGYIRMSSEQFDLSSRGLRNNLIHLTNNAIQKQGRNYGKYEEGNILSFQDLDNALKQSNTTLRMENIMQLIKEQIKISLVASKKKLTRKDRKFTFEIFGFDFMIDSQGHIFLIEANTNPCLEESSKFLSKLIPRMLNDSFRMTIDKIFAPSKNINDMLMSKHPPQQFFNFFNSGVSEFTLTNYSNYENLWEILGSLNLNFTI